MNKKDRMSLEAGPRMLFQISHEFSAGQHIDNLSLPHQALPDMPLGQEILNRSRVRVQRQTHKRGKQQDIVFCVRKIGYGIFVKIR